MSIKNKIKKLLQLSLSDNVHESELALQKALELMNKNNLTREDIYQQKIICHNFSVNYFRVPHWLAILYSEISKISGCRLFYQNGLKLIKRKTLISVIGREKDVLNSIFLAEYFKTVVINKSEELLKSLKRCSHSYKKIANKSFKLGLINGLLSRLQSNIEKFYFDKNKNPLVCINTEKKLKDSDDFIKNLNIEIVQKTNNLKIDQVFSNEGYIESKKVDLNAPIVHQKEIRKLT